jgi:hypothetical protein
MGTVSHLVQEMATMHMKTCPSLAVTFVCTLTCSEAVRDAGEPHVLSRDVYAGQGLI